MSSFYVFKSVQFRDMVEKHKMIADFEQLIYTPEMLRKEWGKFPAHFKGLISGGWTNMSVVNLIEYILLTKYADQFFPGSSIGTLLISKPKKGKLNYQQTLAVSVDNLTNKISLQYSNWDTIDKSEDSEKAILWRKDCSEDQLIEAFEEFIKWNKSWY